VKKGFIEAAVRLLVSDLRGLVGANPGCLMFDRLGSGSVLLPPAQCGAPVLINPRQFREPSLCADTDPVLIIMAMDLAIVLAFIGQSLFPGWFM
jgi:hypothetical protein